MEPIIDIVITWVDGNDEKWLESRAKYSSDGVVKKNDVRFRDSGTLMYLFRSIDMFAPWVRKVHFVTCG